LKWDVEGEREAWSEVIVGMRDNFLKIQTVVLVIRSISGEVWCVI